MSALLAASGAPATPPAPQTRPVGARPLLKREPGDDSAVLSLAAAVLPPLAAPPPPTVPVGDDASGSGDASTAGQTAASPADAANLPDSLPAPPASSIAESVASLAQKGAPETITPGSITLANLAAETLAPESATPGNAAPENAPPDASAPDPVTGRNPELAFGIRLAASGPPATPQPAAAAQSSPSPGSGSATPGHDSPADGTQVPDPNAPPAVEAVRSGAAAVKAAPPAPGQGISTQPREPESRHPLAVAASSESGSAVAVSVAAPAASLQPGSGARGSAPQSAAPPAPAPPPTPSEPPRESAVRELSLSVSGPSANGRTAGQVSLRVVERGGEVQVAVRTTDPQLAGDLRQNLPDLVSELSGRGYRAETWQPLAGTGGDASAVLRTGSTAADSSAGQSSSGQTGDGSRNGGSPAGQQQQQQRHGQNPNQPSWLQALTRSAAQTGSTPYDDYTS